MTAQTIRSLAGRLERHREAFLLDGFDAWGRQPSYLGFGGPLLLPDGRPYEMPGVGQYEAYADSPEPGTVKVAFLGPARVSPSIKQAVGAVILRPDGKHVRIESEAKDQYPYPGLEELAVPLGEWMAWAAVESQERAKMYTHIRNDQLRRLGNLTASVLGSYEDAAELRLYCFAELTDIIADGEGLTKYALVEASADDVAPLVEFVGQGSATAGYSVMPPDQYGTGGGMAVVYSPGTLLA